MIRQHGTRYLPAAGLLLGAGLFMACGETSSDVATTDDAASSYAALSAQYQQCADQEDTCKTMANGDATAEAACKTAADTCRQQSKSNADQAHGRLHRDARACHHGAHHCRSEEDGGVTNPRGMCREEMHACVEHHAPRVPPQCVKDLISCLEDKGGRSISDADLQACVDTAHTCFMTAMPTQGRGPGGHPNAGGGHVEAGHAAPAGAGSVRPPRGPEPRGGTGAGPGSGSHDYAGAAAHAHAGADASAAGGDGRRR
jgi:hypothetical protein